MPDPLAFYLTWTTYGTWLPGDQPGWVKRGRGQQPPDPIRRLDAETRMTEDACRLDDEQRVAVEETIAAHCRVRAWELYAVNCRTNHVHVVVAADARPEVVRRRLKAWCTRKLEEMERRRREIPARSAGEGLLPEHWWSEHGSRICINDEDGLEAVIQYVRDGQDDPQHRCQPKRSEGRVNSKRSQGR